MPDRILSEQEVEAIRMEHFNQSGVVGFLCDSHEALRAEVAILRDCAGFSYADEAQRLRAITHSIHGRLLDAGLRGRDDPSDVLPMVEDLAARLDEYREAVREWNAARHEADAIRRGIADSSVSPNTPRRLTNVKHQRDAEARLRALAERDRATETT